MNFLSLLRPLIRWFNLLPLWQLGHVRVWNHHLRAPTFDRWLCLWLHRIGLMGKADRAFLQSYLRPGWTVLDIGANQGIYTLLFSQGVGPAGRVHAFEPDDMLHSSLEHNIARNRADNVSAYHLALGSTGGMMTLYRSLLNSGDNRLAASSRADGPREEVQIRVARLDRVLAGQRVDFIKMDVQGWEMEALLGMERVLDDPINKSMAIYFEYWPQGLCDAGSGPTEPLNFLLARGFSLFQVADGSGEAILDLAAFVRSVKPAAYINLYAQRR